jgi:hypothetical protein
MALDIRPEFQVEEVVGKFKIPITTLERDVRTVGFNNEKSITVNKMTHGTRTVEKGYMLYFPQGHSMFIAADDTEQLERLGVFQKPRQVDMSSGELVPEDFDLTPKELVARSERNRPRPAMQGGLSDIEKEA